MEAFGNFVCAIAFRFKVSRTKQTHGSEGRVDKISQGFAFGCGAQVGG
jgi:hypothetical protein